MTSARRGFALPAVLWVIVAVVTVTLTGTLAAREAVATAQNRIDHARAAWRAEGCIEIARSTITTALADGGDASAAWNAIDSLLAGSRDAAGAGCQLAARAAGSALDVNSIDAERLHRLFLADGEREGTADSLTDAILDWRDRDSVPRANGAEAGWYRARQLLPPRNGPIASIAELRLVRGIGAITGIDRILGVDSARLTLGRAPLAVIASLPGIGSEALGRITELRARGEQPGDLLALAAALSPEARSLLLARYPELVALVTTEPDAWIVTSHASEGARGVSASIEVRLVRAGSRTAIVRRRTW